jgi:hypothetical protein
LSLFVPDSVSAYGMIRLMSSCPASSHHSCLPSALLMNELVESRNAHLLEKADFSQLLLASFQKGQRLLLGRGASTSHSGVRYLVEHKILLHTLPGP